MTPRLGVAELAGLALQLLALAAMIDAARRLAARFAPELGGAERVAAIGVVAAALPVTLVQLLGFSGGLTGAALAAGSAATWLAVRLLARAPAPGPPRPAAARDPWTLVPVVAAVAVYAPLVLRASLSVPTDWDGLSYHLLYPTRWLQEARIFPSELGPPHDQAALYPGNGEALHAFVMAFVHSDLLVAPAMVALAALFGFAIAATARRLGAAGPAAAAAGALAATVPALAARAASSYVEPLLDFSLAAAILFAASAVAEPARAHRLGALAGLAAGLAAGTKYVGAPLAAALALALPVLLLVAGAGRRASARAAAAFVLAAAIPAAAWYARNALLVGNPFFPAPFAGLPHLERPGLVWEGTSLAGELGARLLDGSLGEALFALPPGRTPGMTLGPLALGALALALVAAAAALRRLRSARGSAGPQVWAAPLVTVGFATLLATYLGLPSWDNPGLFRSLVRFAVPGAAIAFALAASLAAGRRAGRAWALAGAGGVLLHGALAGVAGAASPLLPGLTLVAAPASAALLSTVIAQRRRGVVRALAASLAGAAALVALFAAWAYREAAREARWLDPAKPFRAHAEAALAAERARPGAATIAWAGSGHHEFLAVFAGRRLERRVIGVPRHPAEREGYRRGAGDAGIVPVDPAFWSVEIARRGVDLLVASRWGAAGGRWPIEVRWAEAAGWPRRVDLPDFRIYEVRPAPPAQGSRGGPQPDSQPRAR